MAAARVLRTVARLTLSSAAARSELQRFLDAGFRREQVFEVLVGVAMKTLSNYANHIAGTPLDQRLQPFAWAPVSA